MDKEVWAYLGVDRSGFQETAPKMAYESRRTAGIVGGNACGLILGSEIKTPEYASKFRGLKKLYVIKEAGEPSIESRAEMIRSAVERIRPEMVLFAGTSSGNELGARVAAELDRGFISDCSDFEKDNHVLLARKTIYGGKADALLTWDTACPYLASVHLNSLEEHPADNAPLPEITFLEGTAGDSRLQLRGRWPVPLNDLDLNEADLVIGVGRGVPPSFMDEIQRLSQALGAAVGGTRIAVHADLVPVERQIGTTGKWLSSSLYLALGISGAPQHVMGIKEVRKIIAVNVSKGADIFRHSSLGVVGDLLEIIPELTALLEARKGTTGTA